MGSPPASCLLSKLLAPSDYHLFRSMQHAFAHTHFSNYVQVQKWMDEWLASKDSSFYRRGIQLLPERWEKVIENDGQYLD
jgi:[histone H3]-lysine36 N-dimethyltransferase SETMAR